MTTPTPIRYVVIEGTVRDVNATGFDDSVVPLYVAAKHYDALRADLAAAQSQIEMLRNGDTCARHCEGAAYRIEARRLATDLAAAQQELEQERSRVEYPAKEIGELLSQLQAAQEALRRATTPVANVTLSGDAEYWKKVAEERAQRAEALAESYKADAERYRYLRDVPWTPQIENMMLLQMNGIFDEAIDAARKP